MQFMGHAWRELTHRMTLMADGYTALSTDPLSSFIHQSVLSRFYVNVVCHQNQLSDFIDIL